MEIARLLYIVSLINKLDIGLMIIFVVSLAILVFFGHTIHNHRNFNRIVGLMLISCILTILIPSKSEMYLIYLGHFINKSEYDVVKRELKEAIDIVDTITH